MPRQPTPRTPEVLEVAQMAEHLRSQLQGQGISHTPIAVDLSSPPGPGMDEPISRFRIENSQAPSPPRFANEHTHRLRVDETPERPVFYGSTGSPTFTLRVDPIPTLPSDGSTEAQADDYIQRRREAYESFATKMREVVTELGVQPLTGQELGYTPSTLLVTLITAGEPAVTYSVLDIIRAFLVTRGGTTHGRR